MRNFCSVIQSLVSTMIDIRGKLPESGPITSQFVGNKDARLAVLLEQFAKETVCRLCIAAWLYKNIQNITFAINGAPKPIFLAADCDHHLIEGPLYLMEQAGRAG